MNKTMLLLAVALVFFAATGALAGDYAAALDTFIGALPDEMNPTDGLVFGSWKLGAPEPDGSQAMYEHTDRAKSMEAEYEGASVTVMSLDGKICAVKATWAVENADMQSAREAIFGKMGKTMEVNKSFSGDVSYNYRNSDKSVRLYLGTTSSQLVVSLEQVAPFQEIFKIKNQK